LIRFAILFVMLLAFSVHADPATTQSTQPAKDDNVVHRGTLKPHLDVDGFFEPIDSQEVRFRPEAYVGELKITSLVDHGAAVKKGDVLLQIDPDPLKHQLATAEAELANANAAVVKAQSDRDLGEQADQIALKIAEKDLATAKAALKWFDDVDGKQQIENAELQTRTAEASVEDQQDELDQLRKMYKSEELTSATADIVVKRALRNLDVNKITAKMAEEREGKTKQFDVDRDRSKLVFAIDQQTNSLAQLQSTQAQSKITRKTAVETAAAARDRQQEKVDNLKKDLAGLTVKASFDGVVYYGQLLGGAWQRTGPKAMRVDDKLDANVVVMTLFAPGKLRAVADIPESRLPWIHRGDKARVVPTSDAGATTEGTCGAIIPGAVNQSYSMPVELQKVAPTLAPGQHASIQLDLPEAKDVLLAPRDGISHGRAHVKLPDGKDEWRPVVTGNFDEKNVEIVSGLNEGDTLLIEK